MENFMKLNLKAITFLVATLFCIPTLANSEELLNNTAWSNSKDGTLAVTYFSGNPFADQEAVSLAYGCFFNEQNKKIHAMNMYIGNQGNLPGDMTNFLNVITSNPDKVLNNDELGLRIDFSDGSAYKANYIFVDEQFIGETMVSSLIVDISPEIYRKMKSESWIDIRLFAQKEYFPLFKPFSLKGSSNAINNVSC